MKSIFSVVYFLLAFCCLNTVFANSGEVKFRNIKLGDSLDYVRSLYPDLEQAGAVCHYGKHTVSMYITKNGDKFFRFLDGKVVVMQFTLINYSYNDFVKLYKEKFGQGYEGFGNYIVRINDSNVEIRISKTNINLGKGVSLYVADENKLGSIGS